MQYGAIFDVSKEQLDLASIAWTALMAPIALYFGYQERRKPQVAALAVLCAVFASIFALARYFDSKGNLEALQTALADGAYEQLEGQVTDFVPDPSDGRGPSHFFVSGKRVEVFRHRTTHAFTNTPSAGGPNLEGKCVRIRRLSKTAEILWLGVADPPCSAQERATHTNR